MTFPFGLLGPVEPQNVMGVPAAPARPSIGQRFANLIGGPPSPGLSEEQNRQAQQQAMIQAGLAALAASGRGDPTLTGIALALAQGRQAGGQARAGIQQAAQEAQIQQARQQASQAMAAGDRAQLMQALSSFLAIGDMDSAKVVIDAIKAMPAGGGGKFDIQRDPRTGEILAVNPVTLETRVLREGQAPPEERDIGAPETVINRATGREVRAFFDRNALRYRDVNTGRVIDAEPIPKVGGEFAQQARIIAPVLEDALADLAQSPTAPNAFKQILTENPLAGFTRFLVPENDQLFFAAKEQVQGLVTRLISGAQASEREVVRLSRGFVPQAGETREVVRRKQKLMEAWIDAIKSGRASDPWEAALQAEGRSPDEIAAYMAANRKAEEEAPGGVRPGVTNRFLQRRQ